MEIIWLQRPRPDVPWGFRLTGGREFGQPLSVQKVNPGSVSCHSLSSGDIILKINNRDVTNVTHSEGQTFLLNAGNLLQLTIKKCGIVAASAPSRDERTPGDGSPVPPGMGQERGAAVPDAVLTQMMKKDGTAKPFAYITGGIDLKEFKNRRNRPPPPVMPKSYRGPPLNEVEPPEQYTPPQPERPRPPPQSPPQQYQPPPPQPQYQPQYQPPQQPQYQQQPSQYQQQQPQYQQQNNQTNFTPIRTPPSPPVRGSSGYSEKPLKDIEKSAVYQMIQESENEGKPESPESPISPTLFQLIQQTDILKDSYDIPESPVSPSSMFVGPRRAHGLSFQVLQWMTDTEDGADAGKEEEEESKIPRRGSGMKDPLLRHNADDDEMRFSGLHRKKDIPSKAFQRLNKMTDRCDVIVPPTKTTDTEDQDEPVGRYDQTSIRYTGKNIPSPSFRVLQHWAEVDPLPPPIEEPEPKPEPEETVQPPPAPVPRKLMITTKSRAVPPPQENTPSTDF